MFKYLLDEFPSQVTRGTRPMVIVSTMVFGVAMVMTAFALWLEMGHVDWVGGWTLAVGLASIVSAAVTVVLPRLWRTVSVLLSVPVLLTVGIAIAAVIGAKLSPDSGWFSPDSMAFGLATGGMALIWITFISRALVQARRARIDGTNPLPAQ